MDIVNSGRKVFLTSSAQSIRMDIYSHMFVHNCISQYRILSKHLLLLLYPQVERTNDSADTKCDTKDLLISFDEGSIQLLVSV